MVKRRIIGIDPGLASTGWGIVDYAKSRIQYLAHGCIETEAALPRPQRLFFIYNQINTVMDTYTPGEAAMETLYFGKNVTSAIAVAEARGVLSLAMAERNLPLAEFTPNQIKQAVVGVRKAEKEQVQKMVAFILGLPVIPKPDHAADALGAAICAAHMGPLPA
ncbi:MAG: crossover junction endodeoxyribonuclease RuvC [Spirochaetaceae bacterium]|jgi:crossover junction endodeoxyribonuclease RuvC|nr:crossover junction endodeoxyribonuclease RuvC [Spirochaetaceae bacterium]